MRATQFFRAIGELTAKASIGGERDIRVQNIATRKKRAGQVAKEIDD
jgi:hypothetical protein